jgi:hypothetical protein
MTGKIISLSKFFGTGSKDPLFKIFLIVKKTKKKEILRRLQNNGEDFRTVLINHRPILSL